MLFPLSGCVSGLGDDKAFMILFHYSSCDFGHTTPVFGPLKEAHLSKSSCVGCFMYSSAESIVRRGEDFLVLGRESRTDGELLLSEALSVAFATRLLEYYFQYRNGVSVRARYCSVVAWLLGNDAGASSTSIRYPVHLYGEAAWYLAVVDEAVEPLKHTVVMRKLRELHEACRRADVVFFSKKDVVESALVCVSAFVAADVFSEN